MGPAAYCQCKGEENHGKQNRIKTRHPITVQSSEICQMRQRQRGLKNAFVCSDPDLIKFNVTCKVTKVLEDSRTGLRDLFNIKPNPTIENADRRWRLSRHPEPTISLPLAAVPPWIPQKAIGVIITNPEFEDVRSLEGVVRPRIRVLPIIGVPTTAGTAAEVTINYVITDVEKSVNSYAWIPMISR